MRGRSQAVAGVVVVVLVAAAAALGSPPEKEQVKLEPADQAAAKATVLRRADLGTAKGWTGGAKKPDLSGEPTCKNYHPKQSDLVLTGAAESDFKHVGIEFDSEAQVLQTAHMVELDWQRTVATPAVVPCLRQILSGSASSGGKLVSFGKIAFPRVARYTGAYQAVLSVTAHGTTVPVTVQIVVAGQKRTEITLSGSMVGSKSSVLSAAMLRLMRTMVARVRA